jgi:hypothetical protein
MPSTTYRSKFEERVAKDLKDRGQKFRYEEWSYEYDAPIKSHRARCDDCGSSNLVRTAWYTPDFFLNSGVIIEAKGRFTAADRRKILAVREDHPELKEYLVMLFMRDNRIHKQSTTTYSHWCETHGIPYSIAEIKEEWL